jgi:hypothetical protein
MSKSIPQKKKQKNIRIKGEREEAEPEADK